MLDSCGYVVKSYTKEEEATEANGEMERHRKRCEEKLVVHNRAHTGATERRKENAWGEQISIA